MNYYRAVVYLKKADHGVVMANEGFARLEKRGSKWRLHVSIKNFSGLIGSPVYLVCEKNKRWLPYLMGTVGRQGEEEFECPAEALLLQLGTDEIAGVLVGSEKLYLWGNCGTFPEMIDYEQIVFEKEQITAAEEPVPEKQQSRWDGLNEMYPFEDDEMEKCYQMTPDDFFRFPMECWHFGKNSFLLEGFYNYRHLLYAHSEGHDYIGVPGQFHRREQYLAGKFGFSRFKGIRKKHPAM